MHRHGHALHRLGTAASSVRDNIHSADLIAAFAAFHAAPRPAVGLHIGGGPLQQLLDAGGDRDLRASGGTRADLGAGEDAASATTAVDLRPGTVRTDYPDWKLRYGVEDILPRCRAERGALDGLERVGLSGSTRQSRPRRGETRLPYALNKGAADQQLLRDLSIAMYFSRGTPRVAATFPRKYGGHRATFEGEECRLLAGGLPPRATGW